MKADPAKDGPGLNFNRPEWEALAARWPNLPEEERGEFMQRMTRPQRRRFERLLASVNESKKGFQGKVTTRQDVMQMLILTLDRLKLIQRIEEIETWVAYRSLPWWRRARLTIIAWAVVGWRRVERLLDRLGIRLVRWEKSNGVDQAEDPERAQ